MRRTKEEVLHNYKIAVLDDEIGIIDSVTVVLKRNGYTCKGFTDPLVALNELKHEHYDMLILDYLMESMHGDEVVKKLREFDKEIYVLMLTGHKDLAPPLETIKSLAIQGYCEKSDKFDQLILLIESGIKSISLMQDLKSKAKELDHAYEALKTNYVDTVEVLRQSVDARDVYTRGHSDRVAFYAVKIGESFQLPSEDIETLRLGGIFHDVGKIGTADDLLFKTDKLNDKEYNEIKKHTVTGASILSAVSMFKEVVPLVASHHERIDGKGYPSGLKNGEIPFLARILSVADAFDAMTSNRLYRSKLELDEAKKQLIHSAGSQFDKEVVNKFIEVLDNFEQIQTDIQKTYK